LTRRTALREAQVGARRLPRPSFEPNIVAEQWLGSYSGMLWWSEAVVRYKTLQSLSAVIRAIRQEIGFRTRITAAAYDAGTQ